MGGTRWGEITRLPCLILALALAAGSAAWAVNPGAVSNLRFPTDKQVLVWDAEPSADTHN